MTPHEEGRQQLAAGREITRLLRERSKAVRILSSRFCPSCSKRLLVLVSFEGATWYLQPGGRVGDNASLHGEFRDLIRDAEDDLEAATSLGRQDRVSELAQLLAALQHDLAEIEAERYPAVSPPSARPVPQGFSLDEAWGSHLSCPGCRREVVPSVSVPR